WCIINGLKLNPNKTKAVIFGSAQKLADVQCEVIPNIVVNDTIVDYCKSVNYRGVILQDTLIWSLQITEVCKSSMRTEILEPRLRRGDIRQNYLELSVYHSAKYEKSFLISDFKIWNQLPADCTTLPTFMEFRIACYEYFLQSDRS
ncbi:Protein of unknown function, partial [Cotesia congregata]